MAKRDICVECHEPEDEHHDFVPWPDQCQCPPAGWLGSHVKAICAEFTPARYDNTVCATCEHDEPCHRTEAPE